MAPNGTSISLDMPQAAWQAGPQGGTSATSPMVAAYSAQAGQGGGTEVDLKLRKPGKVVFAQYIAASEGHSPRIVMDIAPL
jgi:hypothetical protein